MLAAANDLKVLYKVRRIQFFGEHRPIVLDNGDSGLLVSICNVLLLRGIVTIDLDNDMNKHNLLSLVQEALITMIPNSQNIDELLKLLQSLASKHDLICPYFTGIKNFRHIVELKLFRVLEINLYHGWLLSPQACTVASEVCLREQRASGNSLELDGLKNKRRGDLEEEELLLRALRLSQKETHKQIGENQQPEVDVKEEQKREVYREMEKEPEVYADHKEADQKPEAYEEEDQWAEAYEEEDQEPEVYEEKDQEPEEEQKPAVVYLKEGQGPEEALLYEEKSQLIQSCPESNGQLTDKGLRSLMDDVDGVKEHELCILLHNNHFSTLYKHYGELYLLETGDIRFPDTVWRKLDKLEDVNPIFMTGNLLEVESAWSTFSPEERNYFDEWRAKLQIDV